MSLLTYLLWAFYVLSIWQSNNTRGSEAAGSIRSGTENDAVASKGNNLLGEVLKAQKELRKFHGKFSAELERNCFLKQCKFSYVQHELNAISEATTYWNVLNCVKYGINCEDRGFWKEWEEWSDCSATCGAGEQVRWRKCQQGRYWGGACEGLYQEMQNCTKSGVQCIKQPLSKPDEWGPWIPWSACDVTCGREGRVRRTRRCEPYDAPTYCVGKGTQERSCLLIPPCPADGLWEQWSSWSDCQVETCGAGVRMRTRVCSPPVGQGNKCTGPSSEYVACQSSTPCKEGHYTTIAHFNEHSALLFGNQPPSPFLDVFFKYRPLTSRGTIFTYTGDPLLTAKAPSTTKTSANAYVKSGTSAAKATAQIYRDYIRISLAKNGHVMVEASINKSDVVTMEVGLVQFESWNSIHVTALSDVIIARSNDGENMVEHLQDSPGVSPTKKPPSPEASVNSSWWRGLWKYVDRKKITGLGGTIKDYFSDARVILSSFKGSFGLGKMSRTDLGFRGYVSDLRVNFRDFKFEKSDKKVSDPSPGPIANREVKHFSTENLRGHEEVKLRYFDGHQRLHLPLTIKWWHLGDEYQHKDDLKPTEVNSYDAATVEITFKPFRGDGILLFNRGSHDLANQIKLSVEDGVRMKLTLDKGGQITTLSSEENIRMKHWNKVVLQFLREGVVKLQSNGGEVREQKVEKMSKNLLPGHILLIGGAEKNLFESFNDSLPEGTTERHADGFHGYIYSVRQSGAENLGYNKIHLNLKGMPPADILSQPVYSKVWFFKPLESQPDQDGSVAEGNTNKRVLYCSLPLPPDASNLPNITWFKDGLPVERIPSLFKVTTKVTASLIKSELSLQPISEGSRKQSGIYSCMVGDKSAHWLLANHVVVVINQEMLASRHIEVLLTTVSNLTGVSKSNAVFVAAGIVSGVCFLVILLCSLYEWCKRKSRGRKRRKNKSVDKKEKEEEMSFLDQDDDISEDQDGGSRARNRKQQRPRKSKRKKDSPENSNKSKVNTLGLLAGLKRRFRAADGAAKWTPLPDHDEESHDDDKTPKSKGKKKERNLSHKPIVGPRDRATHNKGARVVSVTQDRNSSFLTRHRELSEKNDENLFQPRPSTGSNLPASRSNSFAVSSDASFPSSDDSLEPDEADLYEDTIFL